MIRTARPVDDARASRIQETAAALVARFGVGPMERVLEFLRINDPAAPSPALPPLQAPQRFYFPGLGDRPWYEADDFPALRRIADRLEAASPDIRSEYLATVRQGDLVSYEEQVPEARQMREAGDQTGTLLPADQWGTYSLRIGGQRVEASCARCPRTAAVIDSLEESLAGGGGAFFSVVGPSSRIPPHHDTQNMRLTVHLGLVIPPGCGFRVADETRSWQEGRCLFFEDTFLHTAWNDSDQARVVLLMDIWHPGLTDLERFALEELRATYNDETSPP